MEKNKRKKQIIILIVLVLILLLLVGGFAYYKMFYNKQKETTVVDSIPEYGYTLESDQPKVYRDLFKKLVKVLNSEPVDEKEYATLISQMFVIDFYNLDNKKSKNDVGGIQFFREENVDNFVLKASDTVYKSIIQNLDGKRNQELPEVNSSKLVSLTNDKYKYKDINDDKVYIAKVNIGYKNDLGYPKEVTVKLLHTGKKLEIYEME